MTKAARWAWIVSLVAATGAGLVLAFVLALTSDNRALYERHYRAGCSGSTSRWPRCWCW